MTYDFVIGIDVGKSFHHACVLDSTGTQLASKRIDQYEPELRALFTQYLDQGTVLVVVDQPNNIGKLTVTVAEDCGAIVAYLPGLSMRQLAHIHAGNAKTDIRDAYVIAHAGYALPNALIPSGRIEESFAEIKALNGIDEDLTRAYTRLINQIRACLISCSPAFERVLKGQTIHRQWVLHLLAKYGGPTKIARIGKARLIDFAKKHKARNPEPLITAMLEAIKSQTVTLEATHCLEYGVSIKAKDALTILEHRKDIEKQVLAIINTIPQTELLLSMPGIGPKTAARILMTVGDMSDFPSAAHLASYAGLCPKTTQSGTSIKASSPNKAGNKKLKNALWQSSFSAIRSHERSRQYYDQKRSEGKKHNAALIALTRRRLNVLYAMMKNFTYYQELETTTQQAA